MDRYGLIGYPLKHSFSQGFFNDKFAAENVNAEYINFEITSIKELKSVLKENPALKGLNVTSPYKEQVIPYLDELSENVKLIGAVNVIKIIRNKGKIKTKGYNSDIVGFKQSIEPLVQDPPQNALILGTGGSSKAVFYGLKQLGVSSTFVSRNKSDGVLVYEELTPEIMDHNKIIVNCTPVGMWPNVDDYPAIPYDLLTKDHLLYDLIYNPNETTFMRKGKEFGASVKNGLEMLILQAYVSWDIWSGKDN